MTVGIFFLEETHEHLRDRRDVGLEIGDWLLGLDRSVSYNEKVGYEEESYHLLEEAVSGQSSEYSSTESSPMLGPILLNVEDLPTAIGPSLSVSKEQLSLSGIFTRQVLLLIVSYGLLA